MMGTLSLLFLNNSENEAQIHFMICGKHLLYIIWKTVLETEQGKRGNLIVLNLILFLISNVIIPAVVRVLKI